MMVDVVPLVGNDGLHAVHIKKSILSWCAGY